MKTLDKLFADLDRLCAKNGHAWATSSMIQKGTEYCQRCGAIRYEPLKETE